MDFMAGFKSVVQPYEIYKTKGEKQVQESLEMIQNQNKKLKEHYADVFLSAIIEPKLKRNDIAEEPGIYVYHLFSDFALATELYQKIMELTYGKKKLRHYISHGIN
jgi:hypothetical protein